MDRAFEEFKKANLEKAFFFFRDDSKVKDLRDLLSDYKFLAESYNVALSVRELAAQIKGALPGGYDLALQRLEATRDLLPQWQERQFKFYDLVQSRVPELEGFLADANPQEEFTLGAAVGKQKTQETYEEKDKALSETITYFKNWRDKPTSVVVELDPQGQLQRVFRIPAP